MSSAASEIESDVLTPAVENVRQALKGLRYGTVTVIVQDGVVVQVDRTEKLRVSQRPEPLRRG